MRFGYVLETFDNVHLLASLDYDWLVWSCLDLCRLTPRAALQCSERSSYVSETFGNVHQLAPLHFDWIDRIAAFHSHHPVHRALAEMSETFGIRMRNVQQRTSTSAALLGLVITRCILPVLPRAVHAWAALFKHQASPQDGVSIPWIRTSVPLSLPA